MILNTKPPKPYRKPNGKYVAQVRKPDGRRTKITLVDDLALSQRIIADAYRAFDAVKSGAAVAPGRRIGSRPDMLPAWPGR
jgi:hypothetical protein